MLMKKGQLLAGCAVLAALCTVGMGAANAHPDAPHNQGQKDNATVAQAWTSNGYYIDNTTNEALTFVSHEQHPERSSCERISCEAFGEGFTVEPPQRIGAGEKKYFEIPAYLFDGLTLDNTTLTYRLGETQDVSFFAGIQYRWEWGARKPRGKTLQDLSFCTPSTLCVIRDEDHTTRTGTHTTFTVGDFQ